MSRVDVAEEQSAARSFNKSHSPKSSRRSCLGFFFVPAMAISFWSCTEANPLAPLDGGWTPPFVDGVRRTDGADVNVSSRRPPPDGGAYVSGDVALSSDVRPSDAVSGDAPLAQVDFSQSGDASPVDRGPLVADLAEPNGPTDLTADAAAVDRGGLWVQDALRLDVESPDWCSVANYEPPRGSCPSETPRVNSDRARVYAGLRVRIPVLANDRNYAGARLSATTARYGTVLVARDHTLVYHAHACAKESFEAPVIDRFRYTLSHGDRREAGEVVITIDPNIYSCCAAERTEGGQVAQNATGDALYFRRERDEWGDIVALQELQGEPRPEDDYLTIVPACAAAETQCVPGSAARACPRP